MNFSIEDPLPITVSRARRLYYLVWAGVIWSLLYTGASLYIMNSMDNRLDASCESRLAARVAIRDAFIRDPDWTLEDQAALDIELPPRVDGC